MTIAETTTDTVGASIDLAREPVNRSRMLDYHVYGTLWSFCHAREHAMQPQVLTCNRSWHHSVIFVSARRQSMPPTGPSLETYGVSLYNERPFRHPQPRHRHRSIREGERL